MNWILCSCGHAIDMHDEGGCRVGRYRPCDCRLDPGAITEAAVAAVRSPRRSSVRRGLFHSVTKPSE
jgi:hypothetical protein